MFSLTNRIILLLLSGSLAALGGYSAEARTAAEYFSAHAAGNAVPQLLSRSEQEYYRKLFAAIENEDWEQVQRLFVEKEDGPLHPVAHAEYYLAANSPRVELSQIEKWLAENAYLPQAAQMGRLGKLRGLVDPPQLPDEQRFVSQPYAPKRQRPASTDDGTMPATIASAILDRIKNDDPDGARQLLDGIDASLSSAARAEWRQRVAWSYYIENDDPAALAIAKTVSAGSGPWVPEGEWVAGLAAWRLNDCATAADSFERAAHRSTNLELTAAAYYWASRAQIRCRQPQRVEELLRGAAALDETLYGMLASEQLAKALPPSYATSDFTRQDWTLLRDLPNVRAAVALAEIGQDSLADEVLRHQARIGAPGNYEALSRLSRDLGLPSTQLWMAHYAPRGVQPEPASRYPTPKWQPVTGWRIDPALVYAHSLQESNFRPTVVSPAGARGLMQIMPATARQHAAALNMAGSFRELAQPDINLAYGQITLETLRDAAGTGGLLPKVMAAYNAGLTPVTRWNSEIRDGGDPLLWMESIPYWETRGYVAIVMRNYWMYERQAGPDSASRLAMAQGLWPKFPDISRSSRVRFSASEVPGHGY